MKSSIFISHIGEDKKIANTLEAIINKALLRALDIFNSSSNSISIGDKWREEVINHLKNSTLLIVATPESVSNPWVNFESGGAWVLGNRVIPCCAKGMKPSSLPDPLSNLQSLDLSSQEDLKKLIDHLAKLAELDSPSDFNYKKASKILVESWDNPLPNLSNIDFINWINRVSVRPVRFKNESIEGIVSMSDIFEVTPFEASQFHDGEISPGESIRCRLKPTGSHSYITLDYCFTNSEVADLLQEFQEKNKDVVFKVKIKCLGQMKVYTTDIPMSLEEEEWGIYYPTAYFIEEINVK